MEKRHRKISLIVVLLAVLLIASLSFVACTTASAYEIKLDRSTVSLEMGEEYELTYSVTYKGEIDGEAEVVVSVSGNSVTYNAETKKVTAVKTGKSELTLSVKGHEKASATLTVNVPEYEIEIKGGSSQNVDLGGEDIIEYTVLKDGTKVTDKKVIITVDGDALRYEKIGNRIYFENEGSSTVKAALESDPSVYAEKTYNVIKSFWNSGDHQVNKEIMTITDSSVYMPGGGGVQQFLGVLDGGTQYVFRTMLTIPSAATLGTQTVGVTHDLSMNNYGLWFGVNSVNGSSYRIYIKNFYGGWAGIDSVVYDNVEFSSDTIEFITVRDGEYFWFSIDGYCATYILPTSGSHTISAETATWAGIFSQERKLTATNFSYSVEEEAIADAIALCESKIAKFDVTNKTVNQLVKGTSFTYTAKVVPTAGVPAPAVEWSIDKTNMTSGAAGTTIADGTLNLAADAAGVVTVIATCGDKEVRFDVHVLSESLADENDTVKVDGGVQIGEDGSVIFTEAFNYNNETLNDTDYTEVYYAATLKDTVKGDFEFAFTLTDMKSASTPKFMVSFGNTLGNFIFTNNSVSLKTQYVDLSSKAYEQGTVTATFAAAETLEVVIKVEGGHYKVTVNGEELSFTGKDPVRNTEDYGAARPVLFTTGAGTSVTVSNITLTDKADAEFIILNDYSRLTADGFVTDVVTGLDWNAKDKGITKTYYSELLPAGDYTISMNVKFNTALADGKLSINIGGTDFYVNNKISGGAVVGQWGNFSGDTVTSVTKTGTFKVELKKIGNDMYFFIGNTRIADKYDVSGLGRTLYFWAANFGGAVSGSTVEISNFTVTEGATVITLSGDSAVQVGTSATYTVTVIGGSEDDIVWDLNKDGLTAGKDGTSFDAQTRTLTFANDAEGTVVLTAAIGDVVAEITVSTSNQPANQNTALAESVGGVKQDVANRKLIFDDAAAEGVADEYKYSEASGYYAILNTAENVRATIQDNFILEFTVSDYVSTANFPKLMISFGGKFEQFYIAYSSEGARIEAFLVDLTGNSNNGRWVNSENFAGFDKNAEHTFKFVCEDGYYKIYVDSVAAVFTSEIFRSVDTMAFARNVMISTNAGTTATVSNISLTPVSGKEGVVRATYSNSFTQNGDGSITAKFDARTESGRDGYHNAKSVYTYGEYIPDNCEITLEVAFNDGNYPDETLLIRFGSDRSIGVSMNNGTAKIEQQWTFTGFALSTNNRMVDYTVKIKITVENGYVTAVRAMEHDTDGNEMGWSTDKVALNDGYAEDQKVNGFLSFATFVYNDPSNNSVTVSNIVVTNS